MIKRLKPEEKKEIPKARSNTISNEEQLKIDSHIFKLEMINKEIEESRKLNNEEMEKEIESTREIHMNDIESIIKLLIKYIGMNYADEELISCMKEDMENSVNDVISFFKEKFENIKQKIEKRYE